MISNIEMEKKNYLSDDYSSRDTVGVMQLRDAEFLLDDQIVREQNDDARAKRNYNYQESFNSEFNFAKSDHDSQD
ncbi:MAG: hypothetical protein FJX80_16190 [Bacteroidetes bacterium]|nr:hypothetical protein [Bacteroidota bacterium]